MNPHARTWPLLAFLTLVFAVLAWTSTTARPTLIAAAVLTAISATAAFSASRKSGGTR